MALPKINIKYQNGRLGTVANSEDGLVCICAKGSAVQGKFEVGTPYRIFRLAGLEDLGITETSNAALYKTVKQFYSEAAEGTPVMVAVYTEETMSAFCDKDSGSLRGILMKANGAIRAVAVLHPDDEAATVTDGISEDIFEAMAKAQKLGEWTVDELYAPVMFMLDGYAYNGNATGLKDLSKETKNRVCIYIGSEEANEPHSAIGCLAGRFASTPVQRNIGRVKSGPVASASLYFKDKKLEDCMDDVNVIYEKMYITARTHVGRSGYYFTDDRMCCAITDDYSHITARRTVDKAARIAYDTLLNDLLDEIELNDDGTMQQPILKSIEVDVEQAVDSQMTASGELVSVDGSGVKCTIDPTQNVRATSEFQASIELRPFGYPRTITANIGFKVE